MTAIKDMPHAQLAALIRAFVTGQGHEWNVVAAANYAAGIETVLWKIKGLSDHDGPFVDDDGWIWWDRVARYVDRSGWSSGEKAMIRFGCSLAGEVPEGAGREWSLASMIRYENGVAGAEAVRYTASCGDAGGLTEEQTVALKDALDGGQSTFEFLKKDAAHNGHMVGADELIALRTAELAALVAGRRVLGL